MALQTEIWISDIQEALNSANQFNQFSMDHSAFVENHTVHIPQAAAASSVTRNRTSLPASISERTDSDLTYTLDHFTTDPKNVFNVKDIELSYSKRQSIFRQDFAKLNDTINDWLIYNWAKDAASGSSALETSAITFDDMLELAKNFDADNIPRRGRKLLVTPSIAKEIYSIDRLENTNDVNNMISVDGYIGRMAGFDIFVRDTVLKATGTTGGSDWEFEDPSYTGSTYHESALAWHPDFVARAQGSIIPFLDEGNPAYYGSIMSFAVRNGGKNIRSDGKGVYSLVYND